MTAKPPIHGLLAKFDPPDALVSAARRARAAGYRRMVGHSPFPIEELAETLEFHERMLPALVLAGGIIGCVVGFAMQYYAAVISYPINIGGRHMNNWPSFVPVTFEMTTLFAALCAVFGMILANGLPLLYHPLFNNLQFSLATSHGFFLCVEAADPRFDRAGAEEFLKSLDAKGVREVTV